MKKVFNLPAIAVLVVSSASASAWWNNYGYAPYGYAPYGYIAPAMTEEQQKQAAEQYTQAMEAQRKAAEAFALQQAEAHKQFTPNLPTVPPVMPGLQSHEEAIKEMEIRRAARTREMDARRAEIHRRHPTPASHDRAERIKELEARHAARARNMEARRAKMREEMNARRARFEKAEKNL